MVAMDDLLTDEGMHDDDSYVDGKDCTRDCIVMESDGTTDADSPNYVENDDVKNSIAEGYF